MALRSDVAHAGGNGIGPLVLEAEAPVDVLRGASGEVGIVVADGGGRPGEPAGGVESCSKGRAGGASCALGVGGECAVVAAPVESTEQLGVGGEAGAGREAEGVAGL